MICEGDYNIDKQWDPEMNRLNSVISLIALLLILLNLFLSFQTYKRRKEIEIDENANIYQKFSMIDNSVPKSLEGMLVNIFTVIIIFSLTVCKRILQR